MKLYYAPGTCALACWISLRWAGAEFDVAKADFASAEFRRVNPLAAVPALDLDGERAMTQCSAILDWIAGHYPEARLGHDGSEQDHFRFAETMAFLTGDFHPAFWPYFTPQRYTTDASSEALDKVRAASAPRIDRVMTHLDRLIGEGRHVHGDQRSVADAYAYAMARWTRPMAKSWKHYPGISRLFGWMEEDADVREVLELSA